MATPVPFVFVDVFATAPLNSTAIVEQGYALGRPSRIQVTVPGQRVRVGGSGLVVAEGTLNI